MARPRSSTLLFAFAASLVFGCARAAAPPPAISGGDKVSVAQLNGAVTAEPPDLERLDRIAADSDRIELRVQALPWKVALGRLTGARRRDALRRAQDILGTSAVDDADGSTGVVLEESFNVGVGYSSRNRLLVDLELGRSASLVLPAPDPGAANARR